jgi:large subunit ribosomal protein L4
MDVPVYNMKGVEVGKMTIDAEALGGEVNPALIKQAYVRYHANRRQGSARTRNRHEVEGSTKKIYKQKGTGRARHGDKKVPQFRGGGHAYHKTELTQQFRLEMPKKMRRKANLNALLSKLVDDEVRVMDSLALKEPRTREFLDMLKSIKVDRSALVAISPDNQNIRLSGRNAPDVTLCHATQLNCFDMLNHRYLIIEKKELEAYLAGPWSQIGKDAKVEPLGRPAAAGKEAA